MGTYIALLRAVNVGGTGKLSMAHLKKLCTEAGFDQVRTYIASGNVVFASSDKAPAVKSALQRRILEHTGKPVEVFLRTADEMRAVLHANPFPKAEPARNYVFFLDATPSRDALANVRRQTDEQLSVGTREIYIYYPSGMGRSKLVLPAANAGTARNMNTVAKLVEMSAQTAL